MNKIIRKLLLFGKEQQQQNRQTDTHKQKNIFHKLKKKNNFENNKTAN